LKCNLTGRAKDRFDRTAPVITSLLQTRKADIREHAWNVRFGSKADMCGAKGHVRFTPESGHP
jgi:hypothetical protein